MEISLSISLSCSIFLSFFWSHSSIRSKWSENCANEELTYKRIERATKPPPAHSVTDQIMSRVKEEEEEQKNATSNWIRYLLLVILLRVELSTKQSDQELGKKWWNWKPFSLSITCSSKWKAPLMNWANRILGVKFVWRTFRQYIWWRKPKISFSLSKIMALSFRSPNIHLRLRGTRNGFTSCKKIQEENITDYVLNVSLR